MDGSKTCIAAARGENMWLGTDRKLFEAAEDVVADSSLVLSVRTDGILKLGVQLTVT